MSDQTEQLEREAEARRSSVESTLAELRSRMSVGQIVDELSGHLKDGQVSELTGNLGRQVRDNPLALGLVGAGLAWLLMGQGVRDNGRRLADRYGSSDGDDIAARMGNSGHRGTMPYPEGDAARYGSAGSSGGPGFKDRVPGTASSVSSGMSSSMSSAGDSLGRAASAVSSSLSSAGSRLGDAVSSAGHATSRSAQDARDAAGHYSGTAWEGARSAASGASYYGERARRTFVDTLQEEPLIVGAVALAVGAVIGASFATTRTEDELLGPARDNLRDRAYEYGSEALDKAKHVATETLRTAQDEAGEQGLAPKGEGSTLAERASAVVERAADKASSEARKEGLV